MCCATTYLLEIAAFLWHNASTHYQRVHVLMVLTDVVWCAVQYGYLDFLKVRLLAFAIQSS